MLPPPEKIKKILVVRNDRFGEFLLNIPAFRALKQAFTGAKISAVVSPDTRELAESVPYIDDIVEWPSGYHSLSEKISLIKLLRRKRIDMAVILNPSKEFNIFSYIAGIPIRVGYARKWGFLLTHKIEDRKYFCKMHEVDYNLELVGLIGAKTEDKLLTLSIEENLADSLVDEFKIQGYKYAIAIHPWTSDSIKQWPLEKFFELSEKLTNEPDVAVLIIGAGPELDKSIKLFGNIIKKPNLFNLTGRTTLKQLAALLKKCDLLISSDSGPVHLACCVGTPVIAIFKSGMPGKSALRWRPYGQGNIVVHKDNLSDISVNEIIEKVNLKLNEGKFSKKIPYH